MAFKFYVKNAYWQTLFVKSLYAKAVGGRVRTWLPSRRVRRKPCDQSWVPFVRLSKSEVGRGRDARAESLSVGVRAFPKAVPGTIGLATAEVAEVVLV